MAAPSIHRTGCLALLVLTVVHNAPAQTSGVQGKPATEQASAAVKASPDLVNALSKEIGSTPEQAAGAAGAGASFAATNCFSNISSLVRSASISFIISALDSCADAGEIDPAAVSPAIRAIVRNLLIGSVLSFSTTVVHAFPRVRRESSRRLRLEWISSWRKRKIAAVGVAGSIRPLVAVAKHTTTARPSILSAAPWETLYLRSSWNAVIN